MVHRLRERVCIGEEKYFISSQAFSGKNGREEGYRYLTSFSYDAVLCWTYSLKGITVKRTLCVGREQNSAAVLYEIENLSGRDCVLQVDPYFKFAPKETALQQKKDFSYSCGTVTDGNYTLYIYTDGTNRKNSSGWQKLSYSEDAKDGCPGEGLCGNCFRISIRVPAGRKLTKGMVFSMEAERISAESLLQEYRKHYSELEARCCFTDPLTTLPIPCRQPSAVPHGPMFRN